MSKQHRLAPLQVGVTGNDSILAPLGGFHQGTLEGFDETNHCIDFIAAVQAHIQGYLVVATAGRVEFRASRPDAAGQLRLDVHVHVFQRLLPLEATRIDFRFDLL